MGTLCETPVGIVGYGAYIPYYRLDQTAIGAALGAGGGAGTRAVASYDEDTTSMGVEAGRAALASASGVGAEVLYFATSAPAYLDKTNATAIHAALDLAPNALAVDMGGSVRSAIGALRAAVDGAAGGSRVLAVLSDVRTGLPGSSDERDGGDAAAAFVIGSGEDVVAEVVAFGAATAEFLDRWRLPGDRASKVWEERFGEHAYVPLAVSAVEEAVKGAGVTTDAFDHVVLTGVHGRAVKRAAGAIGVRSESVVAPLERSIGSAGVAAPGVALSAVLDGAVSGQLVLLVSLADGADAVVLRTTDALGAVAARRRSTVAEQLAGPQVAYTTYLTWRGLLEREPPRRPDPERPAAPPSLRREAWKFAFTGSRCTACGTRHLPPQRVCVSCRAVDQMVPERLADVPGTITTFTIDRLAYSLSPPVVAGVVDFDGGGRFACELTDVDPAAVRIGDRVEMTFRRLFTASGVHDYFWKARPVRS